MTKYLSKTFFVFVIKLFCCVFVYAQVEGSKNIQIKIDDITTSNQIEDLLKSLNPIFSTFHVNDSLIFSNSNCKTVSDSLHCTPWFKADLDNNGHTDLVVIGGWDNHAIFCILDSGNNRYAISRLTRKIFQNCTFPVFKKIGNNNLLLYYRVNEPLPGNIKVDTLIYKFGDFVEYHFSSANNDIEKIEFKTDKCLG